MRCRTRAALSVAGLLLSSGCERTERTAGPFPELTQAPAAPVTLLSGAPPPLTAPMRDHAKRALEIRDAVTSGNVAAATAAARAFADRASTSEFAAMTRALRAMADAPNATEAAMRFGSVAATCGDCHASFGGVRAPSAAPLERAPERMKRHAWASARLWDGLAAPADEAWMRGAHALADAPVEAEDKAPVPEVVRLANRIHTLGRDASTTTTREARGRVYGEVLATCASCHRTMGGP